MDFELAQIPQNQPPGIVSAASALPFWTVYYGSAQQMEIQWNTPPLTVGPPILTSAQASLWGQAALDGGYSLLLVGDSSSAYSISQVGQIPTGTASLLFRCQGPGRPIVTVGSVSLRVWTVADGTNGSKYYLYGVNCSQFAGMQEELRFSTPIGTPSSTSIFLDDISFSTAPIQVPEPTTPALILLGVVLIGSRTYAKKIA